jgi:hypothetical protein
MLSTLMRAIVGASSQTFGVNYQDRNRPFYYGVPVGPTSGGPRIDDQPTTIARLFQLLILRGAS